MTAGIDAPFYHADDFSWSVIRMYIEMDYLLQIFIRLESARLHYVRDSSIEALKYGIHPRCSTPCEPLDSKRGARLLKDIRACELSVAAGKQVVDELNALVNRDFYHLSRVDVVACSQDGFRADCTRAVTYPQHAVLARNVVHEQIVPPRLTCHVCQVLQGPYTQSQGRRF